MRAEHTVPLAGCCRLLHRSCRNSGVLSAAQSAVTQFQRGTIPSLLTREVLARLRHDNYQCPVRSAAHFTPSAVLWDVTTAINEGSVLTGATH